MLAQRQQWRAWPVSDVNCTETSRSYCAGLAGERGKRARSAESRHVCYAARRSRSWPVTFLRGKLPSSSASSSTPLWVQPRYVLLHGIIEAATLMQSVQLVGRFLQSDVVARQRGETRPETFYLAFPSAAIVFPRPSLHSLRCKTAQTSKPRNATPLALDSIPFLGHATVALFLPDFFASLLPLARAYLAILSLCRLGSFASSSFAVSLSRSRPLLSMPRHGARSRV